MKHQEPNCEMSMMPSRQLQRSKSSDARSERQGKEFPFLNCGLLEGSRDADREVLADWASDVQTRVRSSPKTGDDGDARMGKWRSRGKLKDGRAIESRHAKGSAGRRCTVDMDDDGWARDGGCDRK